MTVEDFANMGMDILGPLAAGMLLGALLFVHLYQERLHYQCVESKKELTENLKEDRLGEMPSATEDKKCYAAPLEEEIVEETGSSVISE